MQKFSYEEVKNAIAKTLLLQFPNCTIYKESISNPVYPHFFVHLISSDEEILRGTRRIFKLSFDLRYREASDPSTIPKINLILSDVALRIGAILNVLDLGENKVRCIDKNWKIEEGVLHFFTKINVQTHLKDLSADESKLEKLEISMEIRR